MKRMQTSVACRPLLGMAITGVSKDTAYEALLAVGEKLHIEAPDQYRDLFEGVRGAQAQLLQSAERGGGDVLRANVAEYFGLQDGLLTLSVPFNCVQLERSVRANCEARGLTDLFGRLLP